MTDQSSGTQPGWYHAQGDPAGTERYWDGAQWQGEPQAVAGAAAGAAVQQPGPTPYAQPSQQAQAGQYTQPGQQPQPGQYAQPGQYGGAGAVGLANARAENGPRFVAALIDTAAIFAALVVLTILFVIAFVISDALGGLVVILGFLAILGFSFYNLIYLQGRTGQTIGKKQQGLKLIEDRTGEPVGIGMAIVRWIASGFINSFMMLDLIWILIDDDNRRLSDKLLDIRVVSVG